MRLLLVSVFCVFTTILFSQTPDSYVIDGKVGSLSNPAKIFLVYRDVRNQIQEDSCIMDNGKFNFKGDIEYPFLVHLYLAPDGDRNKITPQNALSFYLDAGNIEIRSEQELWNASITGSHTQDLNREFQESLIPIQQKATSIQETFNSASPEKQADKAFTDSLNVEFDAVKKKYNNEALAFIIRHPEDMLSIYMLQSQIDTYPNDQNVEPVFNVMSEKLRNSPPGKKLESIIRMYKTLNEGETAPGFTVVDMDGEPFSSSELSGKYVMLVFWSPTCDHCLGEVPQLKKSYELYKDRGLEIVSFALENEENKQEWLDAVKNNNMDWINVSDLKEWESEVLQNYKVYSVPKNYLIDPQGKIIAKELYGNALFDELKKIFD